MKNLKSMHSQPLVSVGIVTYNQKEYLKEAIESVLSQNYANIEIVVGDDFSTDGTQEMLLKYAEMHPGKFILRLGKRNEGITHNSNEVHHACTGKYIAWLGGDDLMLPEKIIKQVDFLENNTEYHIVYHNLDVFESPSNRHLFYFNNKKNAYTGPVATLIKYGTFNGACANMVRASATPKNGFDARTTVASDWLYWIECLLEGGKIGYINEILGKYRRHNKNVTSAESPFARQGHLDHLLTCEIVLKLHPEYKQEINYRLSKIYCAGRAFNYQKNLVKSLQYNPFNLYAIAALAINTLSFKKIKF